MQISNQLLDMAKGTERLIDERKALEHQIAELLTFKTRFATQDVYERLPVSPAQYFQHNRAVERRPTLKPPAPPPLTQDHRYNDALTSVTPSPVPSSGPGFGRPLPSPHLNPRR